MKKKCNGNKKNKEENSCREEKERTESQEGQKRVYQKGERSIR